MTQRFSLGLVLTSCILGQLTTPQSQAATYNISMTADGFKPEYLEVHPGDTVYWWNRDYDYYDYHSTRCDAYPWSSGPVDVDNGVYLTVTKIGTFDYVDDWGFSGLGTLVVSPVPPPPPNGLPVVTGGMRLADGSFQCVVSNLTAAQTFYVQVSTNLVDWAVVYTSVASGGTETYIDNQAMTAPRRFYRVLIVR